MENQELLRDMNRLEKPPVDDRNGTWIAVDRSTVGFDTTAIRPGEPVVGPDGNTYYLGASAPNYGGVPQSQNNAVPTPNNIVQMTPIVQPIALVPYASQNQPMLQYDPYTRPEAPKTVKQVYKRKPYPALSLVLALVSLAGIISILLPVIGMKLADGAVSISGMDVIGSFFVLFGITGAKSVYSDTVVKALDGNSLGIIFSVLTIVAIVLFVVLFLFYLVRLVKGKSPRNFSLVALINLLVSAGAIAVVYFINLKLAPDATFADFIGGNSEVSLGIGLYISVVLSLIALIAPFFASRFAYVKDHSVDEETYIIKE